jgi:hypothetical protein
MAFPPECSTFRGSHPRWARFDHWQLGWANREQGQILPLAALWMVAIFGFMGLAIDVGVMFAGRAELRRAADAAALAAIVDLPDTTKAQTTAAAYLAANDPTATLQPLSYPTTSQIQITASKSKDLVFLPLVPGVKALLIGGKAISVSASAVAGAGSAVDLGMSIDDTGSMDSGCNGSQTNSGCPIKEARDGANALLTSVGVDGGSVAAAALVPSRGCYRSNGSSGCVDYSGSGNKVINLTTTKSTLTTGISNLRAQGGSGTNICTGVAYAGDRVLNSPDARATARKVVVVMSDFANTKNDVDEPFDGAWPDDKCSGSGTTNQWINWVDRKTLEEADDNKALKVEYFVIGYK